MEIKKHYYSETFKQMKVGDTYVFDKDLMSGVTKEIIPISIRSHGILQVGEKLTECPLCCGFGYYTIGGSFGGGTIKQICNCGGNKNGKI